MGRPYLPLFLLLFGLVGCQTMMLQPGATALNPHGETEGLFAKTSKLFRPVQQQQSAVRSTSFPASLHVPSNSLNASNLLYDFGPSEPNVAVVTPPVQENPLMPQNDDSPKLRSLLVEIAATPPENLKISLAETEKKIAQFREDQRNDRPVWLEDPQIEDKYLVYLRKMILPAVPKPMESDDHQAVASRKDPKRTSQPVRSEVADSLDLEDDEEEADSVPAPLPPPTRKPKRETSIASQPSAPPPIYPVVEQLETEFSVQPKGDIVQVGYTAELSEGDWRTQVRIAADLLRTKIAGTPGERSFANEANLRLLELVLGNRQEAVRPFSQADKPINDFWSNQMLGFSTLLDETGNPDRKNRYATAAFRFDEGLFELRRLCPMRLQNVQFVKDWMAFGVFLPRREDCQAGETVGLYLELDNPTVKRSAMGHNVRLTLHYEIRDSTSKLVFKSQDESLEETSPSLKRDYCVHVNVRLPKGLAHGQYLLRISVTDMNSDNLQYAEEQLPFRVLPSTQ